MRWLAAALVLLLAASVPFALRVRESRARNAVLGPFVTADPAARAREGEEGRALGLALSGYGALREAAPDDPETRKAVIRVAIRAGAAVVDQMSVGALVAEHVAAYLEDRKRLDPDGAWMAGLLEEFVQTRLEHPFWLARSTAALYLAARGDHRGADLVRTWMQNRPVYLEFLPYARRFHLNWVGVRPVVEACLNSGDPEAIIHAGAALLEYAGLYGTGADLLAAHRETIVSTLLAELPRLRPTEDDLRVRAMAETTVLALAMCDTEETRAALAAVIPAQFGRDADLVRVVRVLAGLEPFETYDLGSLNWTLLGPPAQEAFFRAAAFRYARLASVDPSALGEEDRSTLETTRRIAEEGLRGATPSTRIYCLHVLAHHDAQARAELLDAAGRGGGPVGLFAACLAELDDLTPVALPALAARSPDFSALAAIAMLPLDGPGPIEPLPAPR